MPIFRLIEDLVFPDPSWAGPEGLLAVGGDLSPERLLHAYRQGIFPWYGEGEPVLWWSPDPRCVLFPSGVHISQRLQRRLKQNRYRVTCNQAFAQVVAACAAVRVDQGEETWLIPEMEEAYRRLHAVGAAHSFEAWEDDVLVGGLYGVVLGPFVFGESMFHTRTDASKVVLVTLLRYMAAHDFVLLDCQVPNPHLLSMGARNIPRREFLDLLRSHLPNDEGRVVFPEVLEY